MNYDVIPSPPFYRELKRLVKKYPSLKQEVSELVKTVSANPSHGTAIGNNCFKTRIAITSKGKGKSGGARVITFLKIEETTVFLLAIYDKSEVSSIQEKEIIKRLKFLG